MSTTTSSEPVQASQHGGMGAVPFEGGVAFRVWAPYAERVGVMGSFNGWYRDANPLASEGNGYWSADVAEAAPGDEYKFVLVNGDKEMIRSDPYARQMTNSIGNSVIYDPSAFDWEGDAFEIESWNRLVVYEMHIGTFNAEGDGPGTFESAIGRLDSLRDLGVNALSVMPVTEFAGDYSWGYNGAYPFAVESAYGGPDALKWFVKEAHVRGMAVLLDVVYNHFGPSDLDLWQFDGWSENGRGGIYFYNDERAKTPWGDTRPDYGREEVRRYIRDNALMWLEDFHADGLRWDGTVFIRNVDFTGSPEGDLPEGWEMMRAINQEINDKMPGKISIAEDLQQSDAITRDVGSGGAGFDAQWDAAFVHPIRAALIASDDEARYLDSVAQAIQHRYNIDSFERVIYTESHDEVANGQERLPTEIFPDDAEGWAAQKRSALGAVLVLTSPGIPMLFQGQELLSGGWFRDTDPIEWSRAEAHGGFRNLFRDLIRLRRDFDSTTLGLTGQHTDVFHANHAAKVLAFRRWNEGGPGDETVVVVNLRNTSYDAYRIGLPAEGRWRVRFNSDWEGYSDVFGDFAAYDVEASLEGQDGLPASGEVGLGPYTALILSQDR